MLYDRLVLPVPPPGDASEWTRWEENGWDPERQAKLLEVLNPVVRAVPWDNEHRGGWQQQMNKAEQDAVQIPNYAFYATGSELLMRDIPAYVTGVSAVGVAYQTVDELERQMGVRNVSGHTDLPGGAVAGVIGREFFVVDDPRYDEISLLKEAVGIAVDERFRRKRRAIADFQEDCLRGGVTDRESLDHALKVLHELLDEERGAIPMVRLRKAIRYAFRLAPIGVQFAFAAVGAPPPPLAGGAIDSFLSIGELTIDERFAQPTTADSPLIAAFVHDLRKHFGWEKVSRPPLLGWWKRRPKRK